MEKTLVQLTLAKALAMLFQPVGASKIYQIDESWLINELAVHPEVVVVDSVIDFEKEIDNETSKYILVSSYLLNQEALEKILMRHQRACVVFYGAI